MIDSQREGITVILELRWIGMTHIMVWVIYEWTGYDGPYTLYGMPQLTTRSRCEYMGEKMK